jgi:hypothetical protein
MFKQNSSKRKILLILAILAILSITMIYLKTNVASGQGGFIYLLPPTNLPTNNQINNNATSTPDAIMRAQFRKTIYPTPTNIVISKYTDLSPSIKDQDKFHVYVRHSDGTYEQFNIGPLRTRSDLDIGLPSYILSEIPLGPGDKIGGWDPPAQYQRFAPGVLETLFPNPTESISPTEIPTNPTESISSTEISPNPYPTP